MKKTNTYHWLATNATPKHISKIDPRNLSESCTTQLGMVKPKITVENVDTIERSKKIAEVGSSKIIKKYTFGEYLEMDRKMRVEGCKEYFEKVTAST